MLTNGKPVNPNNAVEEGNQPTGKLSFRDYIAVGTSLKAINDGCYDAKIISTKFMPHPTDPEKDYLRLEIQLPDRITVENRFVSGYFIFEREIKAQLNLSDSTLPVSELLTLILNKPIKVWYQTVVSAKDNKRYQNLSFSEPIKPVTTSSEVPKF
jgi:hypothetical protein